MKIKLQESKIKPISDSYEGKIIQSLLVVSNKTSISEVISQDKYLAKVVALAMSNPGKDFVKFNLYVSADFKKRLKLIQRYTASTFTEIALSSFSDENIISPYTDRQIKLIHRQSKYSKKSIRAIAKSLGFDGHRIMISFNSNLQQLNTNFKWWLNSGFLTVEVYQKLIEVLRSLDTSLSILNMNINTPEYVHNESSLLNRQASKLISSLKGCDEAIAVRIPININYALDRFFFHQGQSYRKILRQQLALIKILQPIEINPKQVQLKLIAEQADRFNKFVKSLNTDKLNNSFDKSQVSATENLLKEVTKEIIIINKEV